MLEPAAFLAERVDAYDAEHGSGGRLIETLAVYLEHNGQAESAAAALGIHRHTLKTRIERVEEVTGLRLDVAEHRALLLLGLMSAPYDR